MAQAMRGKVERLSGVEGLRRLAIALFVFSTSQLLNVSTASAANHYVRAGASGDGSDWTNAYSALPVALTRGDTYYIAAGIYGQHIFNDANSGTSVITIKKATVGDHGTATGWSDSYASGQAIFDTRGIVFLFNSDYITIDGVTGSGKSGHGIQLRCLAFSGNDANHGIIDSWNGYRMNHVIFNHVEVAGPGPAANGRGIAGLFVNVNYNAHQTDLQFNSCYVHDVYEWFGFSYFDNVIVDHCYLEKAGADSSVHTAGVTFKGNNFTIRYSVLDSMIGTGLTTMIEPQGSGTNNTYIYGNVFRGPNDSGNAGNAECLSLTSSEHAAGIYFYNNTIDGLKGQNPGLSGGNSAGSTNIKVRNNVWQNCPHAPAFQYVNVLDYNVLNTGGVSFVNAGTGDYHLTAPTFVGVTLPSPFNVDPDGVTRGGVGGWSVGAYQQTSGATPTPTPTPAPAAVITLDAYLLDWGSVIVNGTPADKTITITNSGNAATGAQTVSGVAAPFSVVSGGSYNLAAGASQAVTFRYRPTTMANDSGSATFAGATPPITATLQGICYPLLSGLSFAANAGIVTYPFVDNGGNISQTIDTQNTVDGTGNPVPASGRVSYGFTVATPGDYRVDAQVDAPDAASNSFFINIDAEPTDPDKIWDVTELTGSGSGFSFGGPSEFSPSLNLAARSANWRGTGTFDLPQFVPKIWTLTAGVHQLIIRGREPNTVLGGNVVVAPGGSPTPAPTPTPTPSPPNGTITSPVDNTPIVAGDSVTFAGSGTDPGSHTPLTYLWNFGTGSGIADSTAQNPGAKTFSTAGEFKTTFTVTNSLGTVDPNPDTRIITVAPAGSPTPSPVPGPVTGVRWTTP